jgi:hypothetical protein
MASPRILSRPVSTISAPAGARLLIKKINLLVGSDESVLGFMVYSVWPLLKTGHEHFSTGLYGPGCRRRGEREREREGERETV